MVDRRERHIWFKDNILPHEPALRHFLRRSDLRNFEIDDLVAESLTRIYSAENWSGIASPKAYLFSVCRNIQRDQARRSKVVPIDSIADFDVNALIDDSPSAERVIDARDELRVLQRAVNALPSKCREIFLLRRVHELSHAEIASRLGISSKSVEHQMSKALAELTRILAEDGPMRGPKTVVAWRRKHNL